MSWSPTREVRTLSLIHIFSPREDFWSPALTQMGRGLGGFIYLMDAYDDLKKDTRPVSYTHLDVYKRQQLQQSGHRAGTHFSERPFQSTHGRLCKNV